MFDQTDMSSAITMIFVVCFAVVAASTVVAIVVNKVMDRGYEPEELTTSPRISSPANDWLNVRAEKLRNGSR